MEHCTKSLNSKTQTGLLCSIFVNHPLHFQRHNLFNFSSIQHFFVPLDASRKELQSFYDCQNQWSNIQRV